MLLEPLLYNKLQRQLYLQEGKVVNIWCLPLLANKVDKQQSDIAGWQSPQPQHSSKMVYLQYMHYN